MHYKEVRDAELWQKIRFTMIEAMIIFIFTIAIGIMNAIDILSKDFTVTSPDGESTESSEFSRAELLFHLHSGVIGWLSLASVAVIVWYFTGDRDLDEHGLKMAKNLLKYVQIVIPIYVIFFYLGFTLANGEEVLRLFTIGGESDAWYILLVIGALGAVVGFGWTLFFGYTELPKLEMKTTSHYLFLGAMLTSTYGGFFGMILELQNLLSENFYSVRDGADGTAAHAAAMEAGYLYMMIAAILEWQVFEEKFAINIYGKIQTGLLFFAGLTISLGAGFNVEPLLMLNLPFLLVGFGFFVVRVGIKINPRTLTETGPSRFYIPAILAMAYSVSFFLYVVSQFLSADDPEEIFTSPWIFGLALANEHGLFVGAMTGTIFAMFMVMLKDSADLGKTAENIGYIFMYTGLVLFMIVLIIRGDGQENNTDTADMRTDVAAIMGIGLYIIMGVLFRRYRAEQSK